MYPTNRFLLGISLLIGLMLPHNLGAAMPIINTTEDAKEILTKLCKAINDKPHYHEIIIVGLLDSDRDDLRSEYEYGDGESYLDFSLKKLLNLNFIKASADTGELEDVPADHVIIDSFFSYLIKINEDQGPSPEVSSLCANLRAAKTYDDVVKLIEDNANHDAWATMILKIAGPINIFFKTIRPANDRRSGSSQDDDESEEEDDDEMAAAIAASLEDAGGASTLQRPHTAKFGHPDARASSAFWGTGAKTDSGMAGLDLGLAQSTFAAIDARRLQRRGAGTPASAADYGAGAGAGEGTDRPAPLAPIVEGYFVYGQAVEDLAAGSNASSYDTFQAESAQRQAEEREALFAYGRPTGKPGGAIKRTRTDDGRAAAEVEEEMLKKAIAESLGQPYPPAEAMASAAGQTYYVASAAEIPALQRRLRDAGILTATIVIDASRAGGGGSSSDGCCGGGGSGASAGAGAGSGTGGEAGGPRWQAAQRYGQLSSAQAEPPHGYYDEAAELAAALAMSLQDPAAQGGSGRRK